MRFWLSSATNKRFFIYLGIVLMFIIFSFLFLNTQFNFDNILQVLSTWFNNTTVIYLSKKICLFLFWFVVGAHCYLNLLSNNLKNKINKLTFFQCLSISITFLLVLKLLLPLLVLYLLPVQIPEVGLYNFLGDANSNSSNNLTSNLDRVGDATIMGTSITVAAKLAQSMPNGLPKAITLASWVLIGATGIAFKIVTGNITSDIGKNNFISNITQLYNNSVYTLTGNNAIDLLCLIQILNKTSLVILFLIFYNFIIQFVNVNKIESFLVKYFPLKLVGFYVSSLKLLQKSAYLLIVILFVLLLISNILSTYYLEFFINNLEAICKCYFK